MEKKEQENQPPAIKGTLESSLAEHIYVYSPATALDQVEDDMRQWYNWQPGVLFPYKRIVDPSVPTYYGGLTTNKAHFVLVPVDLIHARRRNYLRYLAKCMGMQDPAQCDAYCEEAMREIVENPSPRSHPAFEADALARQVAYWAGLLSYRQEPQTAGWCW